MSQGADVRSYQALLDWYAGLCEFHHEASEALAAVAAEIRRAPAWVEERLKEWQAAVRKCEERLFQAKMELQARKYPGFDGRVPDTTVQEKAVRRAEADLEFARGQVQVCRRWLYQLAELVGEVYDGPAKRLSRLLEADVPKSLAGLDRQLASLEQYLQVRPEAAAARPKPPPAEGE